jgi:uncharacterized repeat protein (TIGR02543 family)
LSLLKLVGTKKLAAKRVAIGLTSLTIGASILTAPTSSADSTSSNCVSVEKTVTPAATVYFPNASSALSQKSMSNLEALANSLQGKSDVTLQVTGYVSKTGPKSIYSSLAKARALIVEKYLASKGIAVKFVTKGVGLTADQSSDSTARRTSIEVISQTQSSKGVAPTIQAVTSSLNFQAGVKVSLKVVDINNSTAGPTTFKFSPELPAGLTFDPATGIISGTAKTSQVLQNVTITASNSCGTSAPVTVTTTIAPAPFGLPAPSLDARSIWIDPLSYENYYVVEEESHDQSEINSTIAAFNAAGVIFEYESQPSVTIKSPVLTLSGSSNGGTPVQGSGAITYSGTGACTVDNATQRPIFSSFGACDIRAEIAPDGSYYGAGSPVITINLVASCVDDPSAINCHLVTFDKNAEDAVFAENAENAVTSLYAYAGQDLTSLLPAVSREGFTFAGWATVADSTLPITPVVGGTADITYYAVWRAIAT